MKKKLWKTNIKKIIKNWFIGRFKNVALRSIIDIIKDKRNLFTLKRELNHTAIKDIRNLFRLEKETKAIKDRKFRGIENLFEHEKKFNWGQKLILFLLKMIMMKSVTYIQKVAT